MPPRNRIATATASMAVTSPIMISSWRFISLGSAIGGRALPSRRTVEDHPHLKVAGELLEPVHRAGGNEEHVARAEPIAGGAVYEPARSGEHQVDLVPGMGALGIVSPRRIETQLEGAVAEEHGVRLARRLGQNRDCLIRRETMGHGYAESPAITSRSDRW